MTIQQLPGGYIAIQLRLAAAFTRLGHCDIEMGVLRYTNLFRRFGFGRPEVADANADWLRFTSTLAGLATLHEQVLWTERFAATVEPRSAAVHNDMRSGPFSAEVVDGVLRTHFMRTDGDGISPLHPSKRERRRHDLGAVVTMARERHADITRVRGVSWLYTTQSYRSLFPPAHIATARVLTGTTRFQGSSSWGQFLDHRGGVKANLEGRFIAALERFDGSEPWRLFPLPTLVVDSPIEVFDDAGG